MQTNNGITISSVKTKGESYPGSRIEFEIFWNFESNKYSSIELNIGWVIESEKTKDVMSHCSEKLPVSQISGSKQFAIALPPGPHNYEGKLFSIKWLVEAYTGNLHHYASAPVDFALQV